MAVYIVKDPNENPWQRAKRTATNAMRRAKDIYDRNRMEVLIFGPLVIGTGTTIMKMVGKKMNIRREEKLKTLFCYDRSLGMYWKLRRPLDNSEWLSVESRRKAGENLGDIFKSMHVLK